MTKIISVNAGSSSLKFQLFDMPQETVLTSGVIERIGLDEGIFTIKVNGEKKTIKQPIPDHTVAVKLLLDALVEYKIVDHLDEIKGAGHRAVHGGEIFTDSVKVDDDVVAKFESLSDLAPLHNPAGLVGYRAFKEALPECVHTFVFDTAFHSTMVPDTYMYALPYEYYEKYKVRRYGFHGTSHSYVSKRTAEIVGKPYDQMKIIVCHLGNGASISAVNCGKSVDTSMGLTPLEGLVMGTRSGDLDPAIIDFVGKKEGLSLDEMNEVLNKKSGMLGISGVSSDGRDLEAAAETGNKRAQLALDVFDYRVIKYIGAYAAAMNGVDAIAFTAGIGENNIKMRKDVCSSLTYLGVKLDEEKNNVRGEERIISADDSKVQVLLVPTNEELAIARETLALVK